MRFLSVTCIAVCLSVVSIIVSTTVVIGVSTTFAITATNSLGRRLSTTVVKSTNDRVRELLDLAVNHEAGLRFGFYSGVYPNIQLNESREAVLPFLRSMSPSIEESASKLLYIGAGFEDKSTIYCKVVDATETLCSLGDAQNLTTANGKTFKVITLLHFTNHTYTGADYTVSNFDPRGRDWYADVFSTSPHTLAGVSGVAKLAAEKVRITDPFPSIDFANFIVHVNGPLYNQSRHFIGVSAVALDLRFLSVFLREVRPATSSGSVSFMVDNSGLLMATSVGDEQTLSTDLSYTAQIVQTAPNQAQMQLDFRTYVTYNHTLVIPSNLYELCAEVNTSVNAIDTPVTVCRHSPSTFPDALIRSLARASAVSSVLVPKVDAKAMASDPLAAQEASLNIQEVSLSSGDNGDEEYYVGIAPVSSSAPLLNLHWRLVTAVPKRDFLDEISKGRSLAIGLAGVVAVCSCCCGGCCSRWAASPTR